MSITIYQTEVINQRREPNLNEKVDAVAKEYGSIAAGNYDLTRQRKDRNAFNLFLDEDSAKAFRQEIFDRELSRAVYITSLELRVDEK